MEKIERLKKLYDEIINCDKCFKKPDDRCSLAKYPSNHHIIRDNKVVLLGHGNINSDIMFVGHSPSLHPGGNEIIFGHKSRSVFFEMLRILGLELHKVFVSNVVFCYIPTYKTGDFKQCDYIFDLIQIVDPRYCILLGRDVVEKILGVSYPLTGKKVRMKDRVYITCYHPMVVIRDPRERERFFRTVEKIKTIITEKTLDLYIKPQRPEVIYGWNSTV